MRRQLPLVLAFAAILFVLLRGAATLFPIGGATPVMAAAPIKGTEPAFVGAWQGQEVQMEFTSDGRILYPQTSNAAPGTWKLVNGTTLHMEWPDVASRDVTFSVQDRNLTLVDHNYPEKWSRIDACFDGPEVVVTAVATSSGNGVAPPNTQSTARVRSSAMPFIGMWDSPRGTISFGSDGSFTEAVPLASGSGSWEGRDPHDLTIHFINNQTFHWNLTVQGNELIVRERETGSSLSFFRHGSGQ